MADLMPHSVDDLPAILGGSPLCPQGPPDWPPDDPAVRDVLLSAASGRWWGKYHGPHGERLAQRLAEMHGCEHVLLCCSGTAAVELALRGMRVGPGDEVILAAYDFKGNFQDVLAVGGVPVLVDVRPDNWNLDAAQLDAAFSPRTRAVIASHLHGGVLDMPAVMQAARARGVPVIEDACQCPAARIHGRIAGTWGDAAVLSFGGSKLLSAGRGGAVLTGDADLAQRIRLFTQRGNDAYPLSELQAAILLPQVERLQADNARRQSNAARLIARLEALEHAAASGGLRAFRNAPSDSAAGYYKLGFQYDPAAFGGLPRDAFAKAVRAEGIALDAGFRALHATHSRRRLRSVGDLPHAEQADRNVLTLHHPVLLGNEDDLERIALAVERVRRWADRIR